MAITRELLNKLQRINLIRFMKDEYGVTFVSESEKEARGRCPHPDHEDKHPSFHVKMNKNGEWDWLCYSCHSGSRDLTAEHKNYGSDMVAFIMWMSDYIGSKHIYSFKEAVAIAAKYIGINIFKSSFKESAIYRQLELNMAVAKGCHKCLISGENYAYQYLKNRGLNADDMKTWLIGFNGNRIVFPFVNHNNEVIGYSLRVIHNDNTGAKYINSRASEIFNKSSYLYGIDKVDSSKDFLIVTEGQMDAIAAYKYNLPNTVATSGTCFTKEHAEFLRGHYKNIKRLIFIFDDDAAGKAGLSRAAIIAREYGYLVETFTLSGGKDLFDFMMENKDKAADIILNSSVPYFYKELEGDIKQYDTIVLSFQSKLTPKLNKIISTTNSKQEKEILKSFIKSRFNLKIGDTDETDYIGTG